MFRTRSVKSSSAVLTVSELTTQVHNLLEEKFDSIAVTGEVSNAQARPGGHWYFSLKDKEATLQCVCFRGYNQFIRFELQNGMKVVVRGKLSVFAPKGSYNMIVNSIAPVGVGDWQLAFEQLKQKLEAEGLLAAERKRPIPLLPRRIGIVTSPSAAALKDILIALKRRNPQVNVVISPCRVQGEGSADEIASAINDLQDQPQIDVIIVARGGGSIEDLWSVNTAVVARAIAASKIPVISGVGHETDLTIADLIADLRAPTPTAAAELVARGRVELLDRWRNLNRRLVHSCEQKISRAKLALNKLDPKHALNRHIERLKKMRHISESHKARLIKAIENKISSSKQRRFSLEEKLIALSAYNVLKRGFSILQKTDGTVVRSASEVAPGDILSAKLLEGKLTLRVEEVNADGREN